MWAGPNFAARFARPPLLEILDPPLVWMTIVESGWNICGCDKQEVGVASGSGWNLWVWLLGVVVRRYIVFLILLIPTPLVSVLFYSSIPTFCSFKKFLYIK